MGSPDSEGAINALIQHAQSCRFKGLIVTHQTTYIHKMNSVR